MGKSCCLTKGLCEILYRILLIVLTQLLDQTITMHKHIANPPPDSNHSLFDGMTDSLVNAFTKVRKPDQRFLEMKEGIERYEDGMSGIEKLVGKERARTEGGSIIR